MTVTLRSDDPPAVRAQRIMALCGIDAGDPKILAQHQATIAEALAVYQTVDAEAAHASHRP